MGYQRDINTVECYVDLCLGGNNSLFHRVKIHELMSKDIQDCFNKYGLDYRIHELGGMGGGGIDIISAFMLLIKGAWERKEIVGFIIAVLKCIYGISKYVFNKVQINYNKEKPTIILNLGLSTEEDWQDFDLNRSLGKKIIILKHLSDEICDALNKKYPVFNCNQSFSLFIKVSTFRINYELPAAYKNRFNSNRLISLMNNLRIKKNTSITYKFVGLGLIKRSDSSLRIENSTKIRSKAKNYYLFLSANILSDYFI